MTGRAMCANCSTPSSAPCCWRRAIKFRRRISVCAATRTPQRLEELSLEQVEALLIRKAMARYEGNVSKAANALGLSRSALYRRLDRYGIA